MFWTFFYASSSHGHLRQILLSRLLPLIMLLITMLLAIPAIASVDTPPIPPSKSADSCRWTPGFHGESLSEHVWDLVTWDDGNGPALYAAGHFHSADDQVVRHIARWDGSAWTALGNGTDRDVRALVVFDDGSGEKLIAGGLFTQAGDVTTSGVAQWDGESWTPLGNGLDGVVSDLVVHDDGNGPALYAGGVFPSADGIPMLNVARWDGSQWSGLGDGLNDTVNALASFDDGSGPKLVAGGWFTAAGEVAVDHIAQWDGSAWTPLGDGSPSIVSALEAYDAGDGQKLVANGDFRTQAGEQARYLGEWDGSAWAPLGSGTNSWVVGFAVHESDGGDVLVAGGLFTFAGGVPARRIARWDGSEWTPLGAGVSHEVWAVTIFDPGDGPQVVAAGDSVNPGLGISDSYITAWDGEAWNFLITDPEIAPPGNGINGLGLVALETYDLGDGPRMVTSGLFSRAGQTAASRVASWNGTSWSPLGSGVNAHIYDFETYDDGGGPRLIAGGGFTRADDEPALRIAQWDGTAWTPLGEGMNDSVLALAVYDDGNGPKLIAAGEFSQADGLLAKRIAQWDGASWTPLGEGIDGPRVFALAVYDDGNGPQLIAAGQFDEAGSQPASNIARWNGASWTPLGAGTNHIITELAVYSGPDGPVLVAGGSFSEAGGQPMNFIAQWNGTEWSALGDGLGFYPASFEVFDPGNGPVLVVGSDAIAISDPSRIAQWDGTTWSGLGTGLDERVHGLAAFDDEDGPALFAAGFFETAGDLASQHIARYLCPPTPQLDLADEVPAVTGGPVTVPIELHTDGLELASVGFSVDIDESCLLFDDADADGDGGPDAVRLNLPNDYQAFVSFDAGDSDGEIDVVLFGAPPVDPLSDGVIAEIDFTVLCEPAPGEELLAPLSFSLDPAPSFGDLAAQDVEGEALDGSVLVSGGLRGDCNSSGALGSADLTAGELEIFDGDGHFWLDVPSGTFPGSPTGCDANADTFVDAGDLSCMHRLIFGENCASSTASEGNNRPRLELDSATVDDRTTVELRLHSFGAALSSLVMSLDVDSNHFVFDPTDADDDGLPDTVHLPDLRPAWVEVRWDPADVDGELDVMLSQPALDASMAFPEELTMQIELTALRQSSGSASRPARFSQAPAPSIGDVEGRSLEIDILVIREAIFADGFESGDLGAWSASLP